jgi:hypothetical protein
MAISGWEHSNIKWSCPQVWKIWGKFQHVFGTSYRPPWSWKNFNQNDWNSGTLLDMSCGSSWSMGPVVNRWLGRIENLGNEGTRALYIQIYSQFQRCFSNSTISLSWGLGRVSRSPLVPRLYELITSIISVLPPLRIQVRMHQIFYSSVESVYRSVKDNSWILVHSSPWSWGLWKLAGFGKWCMFFM